MATIGSHTSDHFAAQANFAALDRAGKLEDRQYSWEEVVRMYENVQGAHFEHVCGIVPRPEEPSGNPNDRFFDRLQEGNPALDRRNQRFGRPRRPRE